jgi:3-phenylpropionate/trans-cinnamate dioxygenase ferredoxin reductase component
MTTSDTFVILGAGLAGAKTAEALREQGFDGRVILLGAERHRPYERPPLSKGYLAGKTAREDVFAHPADWYAEHQVELRLGVQADGLDRDARRVSLVGGEAVNYDRLLLATGASPRELPVAGRHAAGVHYLRTLDDADSLADSFEHASRLVVIGAGWIGMEVAATARGAGLQVTVVETSQLPLLRVLGPEAAEVFADLHRQHEVDLRLGASLAEIITRNGRATGVRLQDGTAIPADLVLVAVGATPNTHLAQASGLSVDNGILTDAGLRTSDPNIFAAGDVANAFHPVFGKHIRVEHWANALKQPATAAASMLGRELLYRELPYFYTDQYDLGMEYVGYAEPGGYDRVVFRGDVTGRVFIAFWLADNRVLAGMAVNVWDVIDPIKALIRSGAVIDSARLSDPGQPFDDLARQVT